ncbi:hypothetical protein BDZ97DRAFT_1924121 [Flammula alnicola]|nr:hypothetical protein BDZ97DRAFT_1924121 [Flammula alnicola]
MKIPNKGQRRGLNGSSSVTSNPNGHRTRGGRRPPRREHHSESRKTQGQSQRSQNTIAMTQQRTATTKNTHTAINNDDESNTEAQRLDLTGLEAVASPSFCPANTAARPRTHALQMQKVVPSQRYAATATALLCINRANGSNTDLTAAAIDATGTNSTPRRSFTVVNANAGG